MPSCRAVWSGDQAAFDRCYEWTEPDLSQKKIKGSHLLAWHWGRNNQGRWGVLDANSASDADLDYAAALLLAHRRWGRPALPLPDYLSQARLVLTDILARETCRDAGGRLWLLPGDWQGCGSPSCSIFPTFLLPGISFFLRLQVTGAGWNYPKAPIPGWTS